MRAKVIHFTTLAGAAHRYRAKVITSNPRDLLRIDPSLDTVAC